MVCRVLPSMLKADRPFLHAGDVEASGAVIATPFAKPKAGRQDEPNIYRRRFHAGFRRNPSINRETLPPARRGQFQNPLAPIPRCESPGLWGSFTFGERFHAEE